MKMPAIFRALKGFKLKLSHIMYAASAVILMVTAVHGWGKYQERAEKIAVIEENKTELASIDSKKQEAVKTYQDALAQSREIQSEIQNRLETIMPSSESFTNLTRELDEFFEKNYKPNEVFIAGSLNFARPQLPKDAEGYKILPFSMNIESSEENFQKFLEYVETSGTLQSMTRLLDIESVRLNFGSQQNDKITFSVNMRAYFQDQEEA